MHKPLATILAVSLGTLTSLCCVSSVFGVVLDLGPEEIVQAGGSDLTVNGYSVPCYVDFNNDGRDDLIVGEGGGGYNGRVRVYLNGGTAAAPQFSDFSYVQSEDADLVVTGSGCLGAFPRIGHFNDDEKKDLLVGMADGQVKLYLNVGTDSDPTFDGGTLLEAGPAGAKSPIGVGYRATIAVTDWDNDGARDLAIGALDGKIHLYLNQGTNPAPDFRSETILQDQDLGGDLVVSSDRSSPLVMDLDGDDKKDLLAGNTNGEILLYSNQGTDDAPSFSSYIPVTANGVPIDLPGWPRSRPAVTDWTGDGLPDLLVGAGDGRVHLFQGVPEPASLLLLASGGLGVALLALLRRRRAVAERS